jgi:type VI protein secretion system component Hcp
MSEMFLKVDDAPGESKREGMEDTIEILSFSWQERQKARPDRQRRDRERRGYDSFAASVNKASPKLLVKCAEARPSPARNSPAASRSGTSRMSI